MSSPRIIEWEKSFLQKRPVIHIGDTVCVYARITEGEKERTQLFTGTVLALNGKGLSETITIYRNAFGCSMERVFNIHSPRISKIEVIRSSDVRRAKLTYIRGVSGKKARLREKFYIEPISEEAKTPEVKPVEEPKSEKP